MMHFHLRMLAVAVCLVGVSCSQDRVTKEAADEPGAIEGLWSGVWGHMVDADGVVHQGVMAELFIKENYVELCGFPKIDGNRLVGTVSVDAIARQLHISPAVDAGDPPAKSIAYDFEIKDDELVLVDREKFSICLQRHRVAQKPLANADVELVAAEGINDAGDLIVTGFTSLRAGQVEASFLQPVKRSLKTKRATVLVVQETGCKRVTLDEARQLIHASTPVAVAYRHENRPSRQQMHQLWEDMGATSPDSKAVLKTFSRVLRPGTLVFVLSSGENVPVP